MDSKSKKTKLTLTVQKDIIEKARQRAKETGTSISEEVFKEDEIKPIETEKQRALKRFLELTKKAKPITALPQSDKEIYRQHLKEKYGEGLS